MSCRSPRPGLPVPVVSLDISSCFPLECANLIGWQALLCAERIPRMGSPPHCVTLRLAIADLGSDPHREVWRRFRCILVEVIPEGEIWPVELEDRRQPDGRLELTQLRSPHRRFVFSWSDLVHAAIASSWRHQQRRPVRTDGPAKEEDPKFPAVCPSSFSISLPIRPSPCRSPTIDEGRRPRRPRCQVLDYLVKHQASGYHGRHRQ